jgi:hypothetical protein
VHGLGPQALGESRGVHEVTEEHGDYLALSFEGALAGEDLVGQVFRSVRLGLGIVYSEGFFQLCKIMSTFTAKSKIRRV